MNNTVLLAGYIIWLVQSSKKKDHHILLVVQHYLLILLILALGSSMRLEKKIFFFCAQKFCLSIAFSSKSLHSGCNLLDIRIHSLLLIFRCWMYLIGRFYHRIFTNFQTLYRDRHQKSTFPARSCCKSDSS